MECALIRKGDDHQLYTALSTGRVEGMITMEQSLAEMAIKLRGLVSQFKIDGSQELPSGLAPAKAMSARAGR